MTLFAPKKKKKAPVKTDTIWKATQCSFILQQLKWASDDEVKKKFVTHAKWGIASLRFSLSLYWKRDKEEKFCKEETWVQYLRNYRRFRSGPQNYSKKKKLF